jgi:hypothetical protein
MLFYFSVNYLFTDKNPSFMFTSIFNFLNTLFRWDKNASLFEKILTVVLALFGIGLMLVLIGASYGIGNSLLAQAHEKANGVSASLFATLFFAAAGFWAWINFTDRIPFKVNDMLVIIVLLLLIVLGVNANTGFFAHVY